MKELEKINETIFESIKHVDDEGNEYWYARELQKVLESTEWRKFNGVIEKAINSCKTSNYVVLDHFVGTDKMINLGKGGQREVPDYKLSRMLVILLHKMVIVGKKL